VELLVARGHQVTAFCLYNSFGNSGWLETLRAETRSQISVVFGDIRDADSIQAAVVGHDGVIHLAALIAIPYSYQAPRSYVDTNAVGTLNVLEASRRAGVSRFIHTSTSEVYGTAQYVPIDERHPLVGQSPYSASKIAADRIMFSNSIWGEPELIRATSEKYGAQATVGVINFMSDESGRSAVRRVRDGTVEMGDIANAVTRVQNLGLGEVVLQSVDKDGTGQGFPLPKIHKVWSTPNIPVIAAGGFGSTTHIAECLANEHVEAVLTSNLLAFLGDGLARARAQAVGTGTDMARWNSLKTFS